MLSDKKAKPVFLLALIYLQVSCFAGNLECIKDSSNHLNLVVKGDLLFPVISFATPNTAIFSFTAEKLFCKRHSLQLSYFSSSLKSAAFIPVAYSPKEDIHQENNYTLMIIPEYKFFVSKKKSYSGYYIGSSVAYINYTDKVLNSSFIPSGWTINNIKGPKTISYQYQDLQQSLAGGIINGVQYYLFNHLVIDFLLGGGVSETIKYKGADPGVNSPQLYWRLAFNVGYRF